MEPGKEGEVEPDQAYPAATIGRNHRTNRTFAATTIKVGDEPLAQVAIAAKVQLSLRANTDISTYCLGKLVFLSSVLIRKERKRTNVQ